MYGYFLYYITITLYFIYDFLYYLYTKLLKKKRVGLGIYIYSIVIMLFETLAKKGRSRKIYIDL